MADRSSEFSLADMGVGYVEDSALEEWTAQDFERWVSLLVSDAPQVTPYRKTATEILLEEKRNYFEKVRSNIMKTKNSFVKLCNNMNGTIEEKVGEIAIRAQVRGEMLKAELLEIKKRKIAKWDMQMFICQQILRDLQNMQRESSLLGNGFNLDHVSNKYLTKELESVDAGEVSLSIENYEKILESIEKLGVIRIGPVLPGVQHLGCIVPKFVFGSLGSDYGQFCRPWGVCSDKTGRILVCDRSNHRIQIFNEAGQFLLQFGKLGNRAGEFNRPSGLVVDDKCRIIVADKDNHRIQVFTYSGHHIFNFGRHGTKLGQFQYPWDVDVNKNCEIAVSDSKNHRVQLFTGKGVFITLFDAKTAGITKPWKALRLLDSPRGLAFRPDGSLMVTDFNNHHVLVINKDFNKVETVGCEGHGLGQFYRLQGIACDKSGRFAVADCKNYRVQVFNLHGKFQTAFGEEGTDVGQFDCPQGICFHPNGNIIVVDFNNNRVQVF